MTDSPSDAHIGRTIVATTIGSALGCSGFTVYGFHAFIVGEPFLSTFHAYG
ncbi:hypothetical protein [Paraburkholderia pallida]|uniref:hypothetical protein n=1 Tax=Paraburkholderia pallida TaxID=2547399 RepID=UPI001431F46C|nr:hypothetical protein [Paraburkholderia pallida]